MRKFTLSSVFVLLFLASFSQVTVRGKVIDAINRQPLESANISCRSNNVNNVLTDKEGYFSIKINNSEEQLIASYIGYQNQSINVGNVLMKIEMIPSVVSLADVVIKNNAGQQKFAHIAKVDLDAKPFKNTQELMRLVPGLFVAQHAGGGKAEQIFLRGFDCDHGTDIQVSVDGMPVNMVSHAHGQGYADAHFIIPETINNIDYGTGPYYTQHGNLNTAGYVSFSTFRSISHSRVQIEAGNFNTYRTLAMIDLFKANKDKQSAYIASEFNYTNGPTLAPQKFNRFNIFGKYNLAVSSSTALTISASAFKSKWDASGQVPTRAVESGLIERFGSIDPSEGGNTERYNANINLSHKFTNGMLWQNQAFYSRYAFSLFSNFTFFLNDPINGDEINQVEKRNIVGYNSSLNQKYFFDKWTLNSTYGVGIRYDATDDSQLSHAVKRKFIDFVKRGNIKESNSYAFVQQQLTKGPWLIDAGVRFDYLHFNYFDRLNENVLPGKSKGIICPKLNLQYSVNTNVQLYVKAGKGFHSNDTRVVVANDGKEILPPAYGADLGIILKPNKNLLLNIAAWYLHLNQEFVYVGDDGIIEPSGKTRRQGIDIIGRYQFNQYIYANVNVNMTRSRAIGESKGEDYIPLAPSFTSTGGVFYKKKIGLNGGLSYRLIKNRPANEDNSIVAKGYCMLDGALNFTRPKYELGLALENMLNTKWNEAQFATESRLSNETAPVNELNYTPGNPFSFRLRFAVFL